MNIQDFGSAGELIAAVATLATLIYLARQVKANTTATQASSRLEVTRDYRAAAAALYDTDVSFAWSAGLRHYPNMSFAQNSHFGNYFTDQALLFQGVFALYETGQLEEETYTDYLNWFCALAVTPGGSHWWESVGRPVFVKKMVAVVDKCIAHGGIMDITQLAIFQFDESEFNPVTLAGRESSTPE